MLRRNIAGGSPPSAYRSRQFLVRLTVFLILFVAVSVVTSFGEKLQHSIKQKVSPVSTSTAASVVAPQSNAGYSSCLSLVEPGDRHEHGNGDGHHVQRFRGSNRPLFPLDIEAFLGHFVAAKPEYTEMCKDYLRSPRDFNTQKNDRGSFINWRWHFSQYNQDWIMFTNFFYDMVLRNETGFYVESGANDAIRVSNTAFLDLCLGWQGLCIEPNPRYHPNIRKMRSCKLITNCLSNIEGERIELRNEVPVALTAAATANNNNNNRAEHVTCRRLDKILEEHNVKHVDLWSLDIEGFEFKALSGFNWSTIHDGKKGGGGGPPTIQSILLEQQDITQGACVQMQIDYRLTTLGYRKYRIVSDAFYYKEDVALRIPNVSLFDFYFSELEQSRCKKLGATLQFFT